MRAARILTRILTALLAVLAPLPALAQVAGPLDTLATRAERTDYHETSRYADVMGFLKAVAAASPLVHLTSFGYSYEGRELPLAVVGDVADASPQAVRSSGRTRVFLEAELHGGDAAGKEALLILIRELARGAHRAWADSLVLLVAPVLNPDGNDQVTLTNRPMIDGPLGGVGRRSNLQGLDLDRDYMKLETPEVRSAVALLTQYDPHVIIDLTTGSGSGGYDLTCTPPLDPDTDPVLDRFMRRLWLPAVDTLMKRHYDLHVGPAGRLPQPGSDLRRGWYAPDPRPSHAINYVGLRNRLGIRAAVYPYVPFQSRIVTTVRFLEASLDFAAAHASEIRRLTAQADQRSVYATPMGLKADYPDQAPKGTVLLGEVSRSADPLTGLPVLHRRGEPRAERMPIFDTYASVESTLAPRAYLVPAALSTAIERLQAHGIRITRLTATTAIGVEEFTIDSTWTTSEDVQGHRPRTIEGAWRRVTRTLPAGTVVVPVDQPLGRLVVRLLEPASDDGLAHWNLVAGDARRGAVYPILRTAVPVR